MRFDIVLNNLAGLAWTTKIMMTSDGTPWRPLVTAGHLPRHPCGAARRRVRPCITRFLTWAIRSTIIG